MATVQDVLTAVEKLAPPELAFTWDRIGLQVGDPEWEVKRGVLSLDRSPEAIAFARQVGAQVLISHHPLIWEPLKTVTTKTLEGRSAIELIQAGIAHIAAHTNWDAAVGGINDTLMRKLGIAESEPFGSGSSRDMRKLVTFVPPESSEAVIDALSAKGAGIIGEYSRCAYKSEGVGTFIPGGDAKPVQGEIDMVSEFPETRVEMVVPAAKVQAVEAALLEVHPYDEPAFDWVILQGPRTLPMGRIGNLPQVQRFGDLVPLLREIFGDILAYGPPETSIERVAVVGGSADEEWRAAKEAGADLFLTGEVRHHASIDATSAGICIVAAGHYATEQPGVAALRDALAVCMREVEWHLFEPPKGLGGRPL